MRSLLSQYVSENGEDQLFNCDKLQAYLKSNNANTKDTLHVIMMLRCGNIKECVSRNEKKLSGVEINNMIIACELETELNREAVKKWLFVILMTLGVDCAYEKYFAPTENGLLEAKETAFISSTLEEEELLRAGRMMLVEETRKDATEIYLKLAKSGSARAMYQLGVCYLDGIGTQQSKEEAYKWFSAASENGNPEAKAKLGDYYYYHESILKRDFTKAYQMYSGVGVLSVDKKVKDNVVNIINQKKTNFIVLILGGILIALLWVFVFVNNIALHSGVGLIGLGVAMAALSTILYAGAWFVYSVSKYNNIKVIMSLILIIWSVYPIVLSLC